MVQLPVEMVTAWTQSEQVGIYETVTTASGNTIELTIEKDFACLDATAGENEGSYPNPKASYKIPADETAV